MDLALADLGVCPKRMTYGPCGGVRADLTCEMEPIQCPFALHDHVQTWVGPPPPEARDSPFPSSAWTRPIVLTDLTVSRFDPASIRAVVAVLNGSCTGVLVGEHQDYPHFPPTLMAALVRDAGSSPWITLTCRDRNRIVLEQELAGLVQVGTGGVLCVTGDGRARGVRPEVTQVFDIDSTGLVSLAAHAGLATAVAEAPDAWPRRLRPRRLLEKQRAGAQVAVLNHVGSVGAVAGFVAAARDVGVTIPVIASVLVFTDEISASVLRLPGLTLDDVRVAAVLDAPDPVEAGRRAAVREARSLLEIEGVVGVNLSGMASARGELFAAEIKAEIGREVGMLGPDAQKGPQ